MDFGWYYFLPLQLFVGLVYLLLRKRREDHALKLLFPTRWHASAMNAAALLTCWLYNQEHQLYCQPVTWASVLLIVFFAGMVLSPLLLHHSRWALLLLPINGLGWFAAVYTTVFAGIPYLVILLFFLLPFTGAFFLIRFLCRRTGSRAWEALLFYPAVCLAPFLLLFQLVLWLRSLHKPWQQASLTAPSVLLLIGSFVVALQMHRVMDKIQALQYDSSELKTQLVSASDQYYAELILGAHWKYHTELCLYDGWRPPYHDPMVIVSRMLLSPGERFGPDLTPENRQYLYETLFPEKPSQFSCACARKERLF